MHFCDDTLVDFSLFQNAKTCGMERGLSENKCENVIQDKSCCTDKQIVVESQDNIKASFDTFTFDQQVFVAAFLYTYTNHFDGLETAFIAFRDYSPPFLIRDIQKLLETYRI